MISLVVALGFYVFAVFFGLSWELAFWLSVIGLIFYRLVYRSRASFEKPQHQSPDPVSTNTDPEPSPRTVIQPRLPFDTVRSIDSPETPGTQVPQKGKTAGKHAADDVVEVVLTVEKSEFQDVSKPNSPGQAGSGQSRSIPREPGRWYGREESTQVGAFNLTGFVYVGHVLMGANGSPDPALINPLLPIAGKGDYRVADFGYWPSYSQLSPVSRHAYLRWLSEGRDDPACNLGYVFLYLYGFERRVLVDLRDKPIVLEEYAPLATELHRLWRIYGGTSRSFAGYCSGLLVLVLGVMADAGFALPDLPGFTETGQDMPVLLRLKIARYMLDEAPIPFPLICAWVTGPGPINFGSLLPKYEAPFFALFEDVYRRQFPEGMVVKPCATRIRVNYKPSSSAFSCLPEERLVLNHLPDVKAMSSPVQKLQAIVNEVGSLIEPVRRTLSKLVQSQGESWRWLFDQRVWPVQAKSTVSNWRERVQDGLVVLTAAEWLKQLDATDLSKEQIKRVASVISQSGIGIEPDLATRSATLQPDELLVMFACEQEKLSPTSLQHFAVATLMLDLVTTVAKADGSISGDEIRFLTQHIETWPDLSATQRARLKARLRLVMVQPLSLASLKSKVQQLDEANRLNVAKLAVALVHADGTVSADEVNFLTKLYKLLGLDSTRVATDVHASSMQPVGISNPPGGQSVTVKGLALDVEKIAKLQSESHQVAALMNTIFVEGDEQPATPAESPELDVSEPSESAFEAPTSALIFGLDLPHSTFVRMLISQVEWSRAELQALAKDMGIMLDGALERINDAAYEQFDEPLTEGEDPVTVQTHLMIEHHDTN